MKKVLMVGNDQTVKGGITTVITQFLEYDWANKNIDFKFIPTYVEKNDIIKLLFFVIACIRIFLSMVLWRPDVIHIHMSYKGSFFRANFIQNMSLKFKIRVIVHLHGSEFKKWYNLCDAKKQEKIKGFLKKCDYLIVLGNEWKKNIMEIEPNTKIIVLNNTIKIPELQTKWNDKKFNILFMGVLIERKGVSDLLDAVDLIDDELKSKIQVTIAGTGKEEKLLKQKCSDLKLDNYINFAGWIDEKEKKKIYLDTQLLVLPSYNEGLPMAILEAISYGIPVVATNVGDISFAVENDINGYLISPHDIEGLKNKIIDVVTKGENNWKKLSENSRTIAIDKFSSDKYMNEFVKLYNEEK